MKYCYNHSDRKAFSLCHGCGKDYCEECLDEGTEYYYCKNPECQKLLKDELPKKGQRKKKSEAKESGEIIKEEPPVLPSLVKNALDQFYTHYKKDFSRIGDLFSSPPVMIIVCNNTTVSKEVYKWIAGYEYENETGEKITTPGYFDLFTNYNKQMGQMLKKPPTLLIDSDALENSNQVNEDFKKVFTSEIDNI